ncbi:MAG: oxidoreductase [Gammaproteobacteria bacterium]|nr:oxidoreductase [Gammaproteobacteria bacterium]
MSQQTFKAIVVEEGADKAVLKDLSLIDLPDNDVLVGIDYSTLNYKDALAVSGKGICRRLPMVCGIDLAGTVLESRAAQYSAGDRVLVNGHGLSETVWGGYTQKQRLKSEWLTRLPEVFSTEQAMAIGTAGYTAMLCVDAIRDKGIRPEDGAVLVTGAAGGVGSVAVVLLSKLGYSVTAVSGRVEEAGAYLTELGAKDVLARDELNRPAKPLEKELWAAAVDTVGGDILATALAQTKYEGLVAACGLAASAKLPSSVMPFILRGVTLRGVDSVMASSDVRERAWSALAELLDPEKLTSVYRVEPMSKVIDLGAELLAGNVKGRVVIDVKA